MLRISQIKLGTGEGTDLLPERIRKALRVKDLRIKSWRIVKESLDARKKPDIRFIYTVDFETDNEKQLLKKAAGLKGVTISQAPDDRYILPEDRRVSRERRPVITGFGPCGMFAALILAEAGASPLVLERGRRVEERTRDVEHFWQTGELDPISNVQFGEGGAGTFSDGKLTTGIKDMRIGKVNEEFIEAGADPSIGYKAMPHIGTDILRTVVKNIREKIIALGGEIRFGARVTGLLTSGTGQEKKLTGLVINDSEEIECDSLILSPGNSSRDTFRMLQASGVTIEAKPFSAGVRIEHPQALIDASQYGPGAEDSEGRLGAAAYKLSHHCKNGRGVYTFCMCPGGVVVGAASEEGGVVTNGMSSFARDGKNANSALLVDVSPEDCAVYGSSGDDPLAGIAFQEKLERDAFKLGGGGYIAPAQTLGDFMRGRTGVGSDEINENEKADYDVRGAVEPTYRPGVRWTDISECMPSFITEAMREALPFMARKLAGFDMDQAVMTGVETRSSCPVRIPRDRQSMQSVSMRGLYPGGEGAGYAGGIMSAAVDGIRLAEKILSGRES